MSRRDWLIELLAELVGSVPTAELVVDRLEEEGVLHLGHGDAEVDAICDAFKAHFHTTKTTKYDRYAARRLANMHGGPAVVTAIQLLAEQADEKYAPVVSNVVQLEVKFPAILRFLRRVYQGQEEIETA